MPTELRFTEDEANEILRTAVRMAGPGKISRDELVLTAAQLGISEKELEAAEQKHDRLKTEEGEREEFHAMQQQTWKKFLIGGAAWLVLYGGLFLIALLQVYSLALMLFLLAILVAVIAFLVPYRSVQLLSPKNPTYIANFEQWRYLHRLGVTPERRLSLIDRVVSDQLRENKTTTLFRLRLAVKSNLNCDWKRSCEAVDEYLERYPERKAHVRGAK